MSEQFTIDFTEETGTSFKQKPVVWQHSLATSSLFSDEALIWLIENHPRDHADFCTMDRGASDRASWRGGDPGSHSGAELLKAVRQGRLWINLRKTCNIHPQYQAILHDMTTQLRDKMPGFKPTSMMGGLLISSPTAAVPYHIDRSDVMLWHIRGHKRLWVYPLNEETLPEREVEEILLHEHNDDVPYNPAVENQAMVLDLEPGMAVSWPLHGPHRVENLGDLNVSITVEWSGMPTVIQNGAHITNGILRRKLGMNPQVENQGAISRFVRFAASRVLRKMKLVDAKAACKQGYEFEVDPDQKNAVTEYEAHSERAA